MKIIQRLELRTCSFSKGWSGVLLAGLVALLSGCASLNPGSELPPVPVDDRAPVAKRPAITNPVPAAPPSRPPGWDAPDTGTPYTPVPAATWAPVAMSEDYLRLQTMLDRQNFSPGCLDGRTGTQSRLALRAWQKAKGWPVTGEPDERVWAQVPSAAESFMAHTVSVADYEGLAPLPKTWRTKAAAASLAHVTIEERLAELYHLTRRTLKELNPAAGWPSPAVGTVLRVPKVRPYPKDLVARLEIHLGQKYIQGFGYDGTLVVHFPCSIARDKAKRPVGELHVANAAENPNYTFKPELFAEDAESTTISGNLLIPPGPNNPVGVAWLSLDRPGYGIHGTPNPEDIGRTESHGCFRLANWNARKLVGMVTIGIPVTVFDQ